MTPERWQQIEEIYRGARDLEPHEQERFITKACGTDGDLLIEVRALLQADAKTRSFLETPPSGLLASISAALTDSLLGKTLNNFEIIKEIGSGARGTVYLAQDLNLGRQVALKLLSRDLTLDGNILARFEQEARTVSSLNHHSIVTIYGFEHAEGSHFIVMEYVEGKTLREYLSGLFLMPYAQRLKESVRIAIQIADALVYAHDRGVVHRDIKPENIMLPADGRPIKILDFGIAKVVSEITQTEIEDPNKAKIKTLQGTLLGTVDYMSPEQARALTIIDGQTDIWSLGAVFYEMITSRLPFEGSSMWEVLASIVSAEPAPLSDSLSEVPAELQRVIGNALAKDKSKRYQTSRDLLHDLKTLWKALGFETEIERLIEHEVDSSSLITAPDKSALWLLEFISKGNKPFSVPDILTPGLSTAMMIQVFTPYVGVHLAERLAQLGEASVVAVEGGDFDLHVSLGKQIENESRGFPEIEAAGRYFAAEGYRLQADLETDEDKKQLLLGKAAEQYELSMEKNPRNARAIRGLARVYEVQGDYETAMRKFRQAEGVALIQLSSDEDADLHLHLSHEILRITRHYIHCILDIMATNPLSVWHTGHKRRELEGYIMRSENLHRDIMPRFKEREQWSLIEWFMGLVFFAKAWGRLGDITRKTRCLIDALGARRRMITDIRPLTNVEQANIKWWIGVALSQPRDKSLVGIEDLAETLARGNTAEVLRKIDDILYPFTPLWQKEPV